MNKPLAAMTILFAWIMWAQRAGTYNGVAMNPDWRVINSFTSEQDCMKVIASTNENLKQIMQSKNPDDEISIRGNILVVVTKDKSLTVQQMLACFPDSIDPRTKQSTF